MRLFNTLAAAVLTVAAFTITPAIAQNKPVPAVRGNCEMLTETLPTTVRILLTSNPTAREETSLINQQAEIYRNLKANNCPRIPVLDKLAQLILEDAWKGKPEKLYKILGFSDDSSKKPHNMATLCHRWNIYLAREMYSLEEAGRLLPSGVFSENMNLSQAKIKELEALTLFFGCPTKT